MLGVVGDARHDFGAAESLRIFERGVGDEFAGFQIDKPQDNRCRAEVHGDAEQGAGGAVNFDAIDEDAIAIAGDGGIGFEIADSLIGSPKAWRSMRMCPRRMVWQRTWPSAADDERPDTRDGSCPSDGALVRSSARERAHPLDDFDHALFALALLAAGCGHVDAQSLRRNRKAIRALGRLGSIVR